MFLKREFNDYDVQYGVPLTLTKYSFFLAKLVWFLAGAYRGIQGRGGVTKDAAKREKLEEIDYFFEVF